MAAKRIFWKKLLKGHPEFSTFGIPLLVRHLSLILHCAVTKSQVINLRRYGVLRLIADGIKPLPVDTKASGFFSWIFAELFERRIFVPVLRATRNCTEHEKCILTTWQQKDRTETTEHIPAKEMRKRFFVNVRKVERTFLAVKIGKQYREVARYESYKKGTDVHRFPSEIEVDEGKKSSRRKKHNIDTNGTYWHPQSALVSVVSPAVETMQVCHVWSKAFVHGGKKYKAGAIVAKGLRIEQVTEAKEKIEYISKEETGWISKEGRVRKGLYRLHSRLYDSIPLRTYGTGLSAVRSVPLPTFNPHDVEQTLCEKLWLSVRGIDATDQLGKLTKHLYKAYRKDKEGREAELLLADLANFLVASGKNVYLGMLRKELSKVYSYDNRIDFLEDAGGLFKPVAAVGFEIAE